MSAKNILLIEDEPLLLEVFSSELRRSGFNVVTASNLNSGREAFYSNAEVLDGIIMDRKLEGVYSDELVKEIRQSGFDKPIFAFSGDDGGQEALLRAGCSHRIDGKGNDRPLATLKSALGL